MRIETILVSVLFSVESMHLCCAFQLYSVGVCILIASILNMFKVLDASSDLFLGKIISNFNWNNLTTITLTFDYVFVCGTVRSNHNCVWIKIVYVSLYV